MGASAAEYCRAYSRGSKGAGEWYLGAVGEWIEIGQNLTEVQTCLSLIGQKLPTQTYSNVTENKKYQITSTQYNRKSDYDGYPGLYGYEYCYVYCIQSNPSQYYNSRIFEGSVRPICQL